LLRIFNLSQSISTFNWFSMADRATNIHFEIAILWRISNSCTSCRANFKGLSRPWGWIDPAKSLAAS